MAKKKKDSKEVAAKVLAAHPDQNSVFITEDGRSFFLKGDADNYTKRRGLKKEPEEFFREGFEADNHKEDQADCEDCQAENERLTAELLQVKAASEELESENEKLAADLLREESVSEELREAFTKSSQENIALEKKIKELEESLAACQAKKQAQKKK